MEEGDGLHKDMAVSGVMDALHRDCSGGGYILHKFVKTQKNVHLRVYYM